MGLAATTAVEGGAAAPPGSGSWTAGSRRARRRSSTASRTPTAAGLLPVVLGLLPASDPVAAELVDGTFRELGHGDPVDALRRYPLAVDDGFHGDEGCFVPVSWWGVERAGPARPGRCG